MEELGLDSAPAWPCMLDPDQASIIGAIQCLVSSKQATSYLATRRLTRSSCAGARHPLQYSRQDPSHLCMSWAEHHTCGQLGRLTHSFCGAQVHAILRKIVAKTLESEDCKGLTQFTHLQRDIARNASEALDVMRLEAKRMVTTMVEMERSYLTAEVCSLAVS